MIVLGNGDVGSCRSIGSGVIMPEIITEILMVRVVVKALLAVIEVEARR